MCLFLLVVVPCFVLILIVFIHCQPGKLLFPCNAPSITKFLGLGLDRTKKSEGIDDERKLKPPPLLPRPPTTHAPLPTLVPSTPCPPLPSSTTSAPSVTGPPGLCPFPDPKCAVHLPHPDPTKFYKCAHGVAYVKECQKPLRFNATSQICDW